MKINRVIVVALVASMMSLVFMPRTVSAAWGNEYIVVAWDEEFAEHGFIMYTPTPGGVVPLGEKDYIDWQMSRALYWFHYNFGTYVWLTVIGHTSWDSDDSYNIFELLNESRRETGFDNGLYIDGVRATMLIAFTGQTNDDETYGGGALPEAKAMIIRHQQEWADDNIIMHEISHMWTDLHTTGPCVMSREFIYMGSYNEPLAPDWGITILFIGQWETWSKFAYEWSDVAKADMINDMTHDYPPPADPWSEGLSGQKSIEFYIYVASIVTAIVVVGFLYFYTMYKMSKTPKVVKNKSSACYPLKSLDNLIRVLQNPWYNEPSRQHRPPLVFARHHPSRQHRPPLVFARHH